MLRSLKVKDFVHVHFQVVADRGGDDAGALSSRFLSDEIGNDAVVLVVKVAHRLVKEDEIAGLAQGADDGDTLLLADGEFTGQAVHFVGNAHGFKQFDDFVAALEAREAVFQFHVLHRCEFAEQAHVLRQVGDVPLARVTPLGNGHRADVRAVKRDSATIVLPIAVDVTAHRRLAGAALGTDEITLAALQVDILQPDVAVDAIVAGEHARQGII